MTISLFSKIGIVTRNGQSTANSIFIDILNVVNENYKMGLDDELAKLSSKLKRIDSSSSRMEEIKIITNKEATAEELLNLKKIANICNLKDVLVENSGGNRELGASMPPE